MCAIRVRTDLTDQDRLAHDIRLAKSVETPNIVWRVKRQLSGRRSAGPRLVEHVAPCAILSSRGARQHRSATETRTSNLVLSCTWTTCPDVAQHSIEVHFKDGDIDEIGKPHDHLKRLRTKLEFGIGLRSTPKYLQGLFWNALKTY